MPIPISTGAGTASVASEKVGNNDYQQVKIVGGETGSTSVLGVTPDGSFKASIIGTPNFNAAGSVVAFQGTSPWATTNVGSIITVQLGSVITTPIGSTITVIQNSSLISIPTGSIISVPSGSVITVIQGSSILAVPVGSTITVLQSSSVITTWKDSSVLSVPVGSTITVWKDSSVLATATITSIATANGGLPIWSPLGSRLQGTADLRTVQGGSVAIIAAQGAGVFTYVDHVQVLNFGSSSVLVTIADVTTSILGYTIAPAGGGSNYDTFYKTAANNPITASLSGTASVLVSMQGFKSAT